MLYLLGLALASFIGIAGFVFTSAEKEKHDHQKRQLSQSNSALRMLQNTPGPEVVNLAKMAPKTPASSPKLVSGPLAIISILISLIVSAVSLAFFFRKSQQQRRHRLSSIVGKLGQPNGLNRLQQKFVARARTHKSR